MQGEAEGAGTIMPREEKARAILSMCLMWVGVKKADT